MRFVVGKEVVAQVISENISFSVPFFIPIMPYPYLLSWAGTKFLLRGCRTSSLQLKWKFKEIGEMYVSNYVT
jgi:hypothetical protein